MPCLCQRLTNQVTTCIYSLNQPAYTACEPNGQNQAFVRKAANVAGSNGKRFSQNYGMHLHAHATGHAPRDAAVRSRVGTRGIDGQSVWAAGVSSWREPSALERLVDRHNRRMV